jgi:hypothetical protein
VKPTNLIVSEMDLSLPNPSHNILNQAAFSTRKSNEDASFSARLILMPTKEKKKRHDRASEGFQIMSEEINFCLLLASMIIVLASNPRSNSPSWILCRLRRQEESWTKRK